MIYCDLFPLYLFLLQLLGGFPKQDSSWRAFRTFDTLFLCHVSSIEIAEGMVRDLKRRVRRRSVVWLHTIFFVLLSNNLARGWVQDLKRRVRRRSVMEPCILKINCSIFCFETLHQFEFWNLNLVAMTLVFYFLMKSMIFSSV